MPEGVDKGGLYLPEQSGLELLQFSSSAYLGDTLVEKLENQLPGIGFPSVFVCIFSQYLQEVQVSLNYWDGEEAISKTTLDS